MQHAFGASASCLACTSRPSIPGHCRSCRGRRSRSTETPLTGEVRSNVRATRQGCDVQFVPIRISREFTRCSNQSIHRFGFARPCSENSMKNLRRFINLQRGFWRQSQARKSDSFDKVRCDRAKVVPRSYPDTG
jgi:hypothetical protein